MQTKILLPEDRIPKQWYNIIPDMPGPLAPVINPRTMQPVTPDDLLPIFPMAIIEQEVSSQRWMLPPSLAIARRTRGMSASSNSSKPMSPEWHAEAAQKCG